MDYKIIYLNNIAYRSNIDPKTGDFKSELRKARFLIVVLFCRYFGEICS